MTLESELGNFTNRLSDTNLSVGERKKAVEDYGNFLRNNNITNDGGKFVALSGSNNFTEAGGVDNYNYAKISTNYIKGYANQIHGANLSDVDVIDIVSHIAVGDANLRLESLKESQSLLIDPIGFTGNIRDSLSSYDLNKSNPQQSPIMLGEAAYHGYSWEELTGTNSLVLPQAKNPLYQVSYADLRGIYSAKALSPEGTQNHLIATQYIDIVVNTNIYEGVIDIAASKAMLSLIPSSISSLKPREVAKILANGTSGLSSAYQDLAGSPAGKLLYSVRDMSSSGDGNGNVLPASKDHLLSKSDNPELVTLIQNIDSDYLLVSKRREAFEEAAKDFRVITIDKDGNLSQYSIDNKPEIGDGSYNVILKRTSIDENGVTHYEVIQISGDEYIPKDKLEDLANALEGTNKIEIEEASITLENVTIDDGSGNLQNLAYTDVIENIAYKYDYSLNDLLSIAGNEDLLERYIVLDNGKKAFLYKENGVVNLQPGDNDAYYVPVKNYAVFNADGVVYDSTDVEVPDPAEIDKTNLTVTVSTDPESTSGHSSDLTQTGNVIDGGDHQIAGPIEHVNGNGVVNVMPWFIASDGYRPGNTELSDYANFNTDITADFSQLDSLNQNISNSPLDVKLDFKLYTPLTSITNRTIAARELTNIDPLILDLDGDGVELISYADSEVTFDVDNDQMTERTGWVSGSDGMLVHDKNGDGVINDITETISEYYNPEDGSIADLEGKYSQDGLDALSKLDSNNDDVFNSQDAQWDNLRVWQDANEDGITDEGELRTLDETGVQEIHLGSNITQAYKERNEGNVVLSRSTYTDINGNVREAAAVDFTTNPIGYEFNDVNLGKLATAEDGTQSLVISNIDGETVVASDETAQNIFGNSGDDTITGDIRDNWLSGGAGSDVLRGEGGDDILIIDEKDLQENIDGGEGRDVVMINSDVGVSFNLTDSNVETAIGGNGDDVLIGGGTGNVFIDGGNGDDIIIGGASDDALSGSDGNDYIDGGYSNDVIRGHRGEDVLIGGEGDDYLEGGLGDDKIFGGAGKEVIVEGAGSDEIDGGDDYDLVKYKGSFKDYDVERDGENFKVTDSDGNIDTLKNVEAIRFSDITLTLEADNSAPMPVADVISLENKQDTIFISQASLLENDKDIDGDELTMISVQNVVGGFARLVKDSAGNVQGVEFTPEEGFIGNMSFDYDVKDSNGAYTLVEQRSNDGTSISAPMKARVTFKLDSDPTDALYSKQWYLSEINVQKAWEDYSGNGVTIGVFEDGDFNRNHQDLDDNILASHKLDQEFRQVDQFAQHATTVAGVIAAEQNDYGIIGVAHGAMLDGYSWDADESGLFNLKNVDIANNSWGMTLEFADNFLEPDYQIYKNVLETSVQVGRDGLGTINVFAGGNQREEGDNVNYHNLQNSRFVITTGSINQEADLGALIEASTPFSNPGAAILVSAPGSNISSTGNELTNANGSTFLGEFSSSQGTSFSAPIVSGIVALMLEANPDLGYRDVQKILAISARKFDDPNTVWQDNGAENWNGGAMHFSHDYGYGIVDAASAVRLAETWREVSSYYNEQSLIAEEDGFSPVEIVDNDTVGKQFAISDSGMENIETVEVEVNLSHLSLSDLIIKLISPNGTESVLMDQPQNSAYEGGLNFTFSSRAFLGEKVDGDWRIEVTDSVSGNTGYLNSWKLKIYGKLDDGKDDTYIYTDEFAKLTDGARAIINDSDGGIDVLNVAAVSGDSYIDLNAGQTSVIAGKDVLIAGGTPGDEYYQKKDELPIKELELAAKQSELDSKTQSLAAKQAELSNLDGAIADKLDEHSQKSAEYQTALDNFNNNSNKIFFDEYRFEFMFYREYIFIHKANGSNVSLSKSSYDHRVNEYNKLYNIQDSKGSEVNDVVIEYNFLLEQKSSLPEEVGVLSNEVSLLLDQATSLTSEVNFIKNYIDSFNENGASAIEDVYAGDGDDTIIGSDLDNKIWGGRGENTLTGKGGSDTFIIKKDASTTDTIIDFEVGVDQIDLSDFGDINFSDLSIVQNGTNTEISTPDGQKIILEEINAGEILSNSFLTTSTASSADMNNIIEALPGIDYLEGTYNDDMILSQAMTGVINAFAGDDEISAGVGDDQIYGGFGDDRVYGGAGDDSLYGDADLNANNSVIGNEERNGADALFGGAGDDSIYGGGGNDYIDGGADNDLLIGGAGDDIIIGGSGNNEIQAGEGDDVIDIGDGRISILDAYSANFVKGDGGSDRFIISDKMITLGNKFDIIADFDVSDVDEKIDLSRIKAVNDYYDLNIYQHGADAYISFNDNNFGYSQAIKLENVDVSDLNASKFIITNDAPEAVSDIAFTNEDISITISILANDSDDKTEIDDLQINILNITHGAVQVNYNGTITYTPNADFNGIDEIEYEILDAGGLVSNRAKVIITIDAVNDAPIVTKIIDNQTFYSTRDISFSASDVFSEVDGEDITYSVSLEDGSELPSWISFDAETQIFSGLAPDNSDAFVIQLTATDESGYSTSTNFNLTIDDTIIVGTDGDDNLNGTSADDFIDGSLGNDVIAGGSGDDIIYGGAGADQISSGSGNDTLYGEEGDDVLHGNVGNQILDGGEGNDVLYSAGRRSDDVLTGGSGSDIFIIGNDKISNDVITDFDVNDADEKIDLSLFNDVVTDFSQLTMEQVGSDTQISFSSKSKTILIKNVTMDQLTIDNFIGLTDYQNSSDNVIITGTSSDDNLVGGSGDDIISGAEGDDTIKGNLGSNLLTGGSGDDVFVISKNANETDIIADFEAFDHLEFEGFVDGTKLADFAYIEEGNSVTFDLGDSQNLRFQNATAAEILQFSSYDETTNVSDSYDAITTNEKIILSTSYNNKVVNGSDGDDLISGSDKSDIINGGKGNDVLRGGKWFDSFEIDKNPGDKDVILDLTINDMVDSVVLKGFVSDTLSDYQAVQNGNDVIIDLGDEQTLTLKNFKIEDVPYIPNYSHRIYDYDSSSVADTDGNDLIVTNSWYPGGSTIITSSGEGNDVLTGAGFAKDLFVINKNPGDYDFIRYVDTWRNDKVVLKGFSNDILDEINFLPSDDPYILIMDLGDGQILRTYGVQESEFRQYFDVEKTINPTDGDDNLDAGYFYTDIDGGAGNDVIEGNDFDNTLIGGDGDDIITAGAGADIINGGTGNDKIILTDNGNKTITGGEGSETYKVYSFTGEITITDFAISDASETIDLREISNIFAFPDLTILQEGTDAVIELSSSQKIILQNIDASLLTADKFKLYDNQFDGSPISDYFDGGHGDDVINGYAGNDSVSLNSKGLDSVDLGDGDDIFSMSGSGYYGNDNVTGGAGNDQFTIDLGYSYADTDYTLMINDFEATNPNEKIFIKNGSSTNMDFDDDLILEQIGNDVQIVLTSNTGGKSILLKNVNVADLSKDNIILPKESYQVLTTDSDDHITYDANAGSENLFGEDRGISLNGTLTNVSMVISGDQTTLTLRDFDPTTDRIKVDSSYGVTQYSDMPLAQEGANVVMEFVDETIPLSSGGSSYGSTRNTKVVLENVNLADLGEEDFIFYNHSSSGDDFIRALSGDDYIEGGLGNDTIYGNEGDDSIYGGEGDDNISGDVGDDNLFGGSGSDSIAGNLGSDEIYGGDGDDQLSDYAGSNKIYGGAGNDVIGVAVYYSYNTLIQSDNEVYGEEGDDRISITDGTNIAKGGVGNDTFFVYGGNNNIYGEEGIDNFFISKAITSTYDGTDYVSTHEASSTIIYDFDARLETITLKGFDYEAIDYQSVYQDGNDTVISFSEIQTVRLKNVNQSSLNSGNIIIPNEDIEDRYNYIFNRQTNEFSIKDIAQLDTKNFYGYFDQGSVVELSEYDDTLMMMISSFDSSIHTIHLGKNKSVEKFDDLIITQHTVRGTQSSEDFTLIALGDGSFVKLLGFHENLNESNFVFNKDPIANLTSIEIDEDISQEFDVIKSSSDADDDILTISNITNPSNGSAAIIIDDQGKQKISYSPNANFNGIDQLNYTLSDGNGGTVTKTLSITVNEINDNPNAEIDSAVVDEDNSIIIDVLLGASDADGDNLSVSSVYGVTNGTAEIINGKIIYTPNSNYHGIDSFNYSISDGRGGLTTKTLNVNVNSINDNPNASLVEITTNEDTTLIIDVLSNVIDVDNDNLTLSLVDGVSNGTAQIINSTIIDAFGNEKIIQKIEYIPTDNFNGLDSLNYKVDDGNGGVVTKTLNITVTSINDDPIANNDNVVVNEDSSVVINAISNDLDIEDNQFEKNNIGIIASVLNGTLVLNDDLTFTYTPDFNFNGSDSFSYQVKDADGTLSNIATVQINVNALNDAPIIDGSLSSQSVAANQLFTYDLSNSLSFIDVENDEINVDVRLSDGSELPSWLTFDQSSNILSGIAGANDAGSLSLQVIASDGEASAAQSFKLSISNPIAKKSDIEVNIIGVSDDGSAQSSEGTIDIVQGDDADNTIYYTKDENWVTSDYVAWNTYSNDEVAVFGLVRSNDAFDGGAGNDTLILTNQSDGVFLDDLISSNPSSEGHRLFGIETINGGLGDDVIDLTSLRYIYGDVTLNGEGGDDVLWGNDGNDTLNGGIGSDNIQGGRGNDIMSGDVGDDIIKGFDGDDILNGGLGVDSLTGDAGSDIFNFSNLLDSGNAAINKSDIITDFTQGEDSISFTGLNFVDIINQNDATAAELADNTHLFYQKDVTNDVTVITNSDESFQITLNGQFDMVNSDFNFG